MEFPAKLILVVMLLWPTVSSAGDKFPSDAFLKEDNRWEGIVDKPVSARFELVSLRRGLIPKFKSGDQLVVSFFAPSNQEARMRARKLKPAGTVYAMEAKERAWQRGLNVFRPWSVSDVLVPKKISHRNLGIEVKAENGTYLPAWVGLKENTDSHDYYLHFYTPTSIKKLNYKVFDISNSAIFEGQRKAISSKETFFIKLDMTGVKSGPFSLQMSIKWKHDPGTHRPSLSFFHQNTEK